MPVNAILVLILMSTAFAIGTLVAVFHFGARSGRAFWYQQLQRTRMQAALAERRLHDLTRDVFISMAEHAERHGHGS